MIGKYQSQVLNKHMPVFFLVWLIAGKQLLKVEPNKGKCFVNDTRRDKHFIFQVNSVLHKKLASSYIVFFIQMSQIKPSSYNCVLICSRNVRLLTLSLILVTFSRTTRSFFALFNYPLSVAIPSNILQCNVYYREYLAEDGKNKQ